MYKDCSESNASCFIVLLTVSELDACGTAVEAKPSHQYSITFLLAQKVMASQIF